MDQQNQQNGFRQGRPTLGALNISLYNTVERVQWNGLCDAARQYDVNLLGFFGEALCIPKGFSAQGNILYSLVNQELLDGVIVFSEALESYVDAHTMEQFVRKFHPLPVVSVERPFPQIPAILMDNYQAMCEVMRHLIEVHHHHRIAFIRGPVHHVGAQERYRAYCDMLAEYHLPVNPDLVTPPVFWVERRAMISVLVEERHLRPKLDFDAVVTAWDYQAFRAIEYLKAQGIGIPDDVAVAGFDNDEVAPACSPPLTTVQPPFYDMAGKAIETLLDLIQQSDVPEQMILPTALLVRQSCGCRSQTVQHTIMEPAYIRSNTDKTSLADHQEALVRDILQKVGESNTNHALATTLVEAFLEEFTSHQPGRFLAALEEVLQQLANSGKEIAIWQYAISVLRQASLASEDNVQEMAHIENVWQQARVYIGEMAGQVQISQRFQEIRQERRLQAFEVALSTTFNVQGVLEAIRHGFPRLGIPGCYLAIYDPPSDEKEAQPYHYPDPAPPWSRLILAYNDENCNLLDPEGVRFPSHQVVPHHVLPQQKRYTLVIEPLYFRERQIGFILFEVGPRGSRMYEALRLQISSALQGARLFAEVTRQKYVLDTFMETIPDRIYFKSLEGRVTKSNRAHAAQLGLSDPSEEIGKTDFDFFPEAQAQSKYDQEQQIIQTGQPLIGLEEPDGKGRWVLTTKMPLRDEHGNIIGTFGISRDITKLKQTEQELRQYREHLEEIVEERTAELTRSNALLNEEVLERLRIERALRTNEEQYRMLAENVKDGIVIIQDEKIVFANAVFAAMIGSPSQHLIMTDPLEWFHERIRPLAYAQLTGNTPEHQQPQWQAELVTRDGRGVWTEIEQAEIVWNSQPASLLTIRDITDRRLREQRLEQERARLEEENLSLRTSIRERYRFGALVGKSPAMQRVYELIVSAATSDVNIMLWGESGTGKELIARTIHQVSRRKAQAFVAVNCASIPETLFEREFFGHRKGAFTGADRNTPGLFDRAHQGILFLDEVTELSPGTQAKLLRVLQDGEYIPLGSTISKQADVLIIAATNRNCHEEIQQGRMRQDFFYRLGIIEICVPPLRSRKEDLPLLIEHILEAYRQKQVQVQGSAPHDLPADQTMLPGELVQMLYQYEWPGNIRELQNVLQRYLATQDLDALRLMLSSAVPYRGVRESISPTSIPATLSSMVPTSSEPNSFGLNLVDAVKAYEKQVIANMLARNHQNIRKTADMLGLPLRTLYHKIHLYNLKSSS